VPELPEVETVKLGLNQHTLGWQIIGGEVLLEKVVILPSSATELFFVNSLPEGSLNSDLLPNKDLNVCLTNQFIRAITGLVIHNWQRRGKYLLAELRTGSNFAGYLGVHLRMTGRLLWSDRFAPIHKHTRLRLFLQKEDSDQEFQEQELRFDDQRTFGRVWYVPPEFELESVITGLQKLGREPLELDFSEAYLQIQLSKSDRPIKTLLLDQSTLAGIGNIYADESLFLAKIHPNTPSRSLNVEQIKALHKGIKQCLSDGIAWGGTTFSDFQDIGGDKGNYLDRAWVFRRQGQPCRICETAIKRFKLGGRSTHFCPTCQMYFV
jgi:formamidopyrimidine-DNA glycosylase